MTPSATIAFPRPIELPTTRVRALTANGFDLLLRQLDNNREEAARKYVSLHTRLTRYFEWRGCDLPDWYADETMTRIARRIEKGIVIVNFQGFLFGVARKLAIEASKEREREQKLISRLSRDECACSSFEDEDRLSRLDAALFRMTPRSRELLLAYYSTGDDKNMELRRKLAQREGISMNALRIRVHRLRTMLETYFRAELDGDAQVQRRSPQQVIISADWSKATLHVV